MTRKTVLMGLVLLGAGCRGGKGGGGPSLDTMVQTVAVQLAETLLPPPSRSLSSPSDPPLLSPGGKTRVVITADEAAFVALIGPKATTKQVFTVVQKVSDALGQFLKRRRLESVAAPFPALVADTETARSVVATLTPFTLVTGSPDDKARGKSETLIMARLIITDPKTGQTLAQREFYSGYTLPR